MSQTHPFKPIFDKNSKILILGSFPSIVSRKIGFYYANPQNRFWRMLAGILNATPPVSTDEKIKFLLTHRIAIYDAAISCEIKGSSDAKITHEICEKYLKTQILNATGREVVKLPSTSSANANFNFERLVREWAVVAEALKYS